MAAEPPAPELVVGGWLVDGRDRPLAGARVELWPLADDSADREPPRSAATAETVSAADGRFVLAVPEPGFWSLRVSAAARVPVEVRLGPLLYAAELAPIELPADRELAVRVVGPAGRPLAGARVELDARPGRRAPPPRPPFDAAPSPRPAIALSDATGRAVLRALAVGRHSLRVTAAGFATRIMTGELPSPLRAELLPRDSGVGASGPAPERPDGGEVADSTPAVSGRVLAAPPRTPIAGALVWAAGDPAAFVRTGGDGRYRLRPPVAERRTDALTAVVPGYFPARLSAPAAGSGPAPTLVLRPAAVVRGLVVDAGDRPVAGAEVRPLPLDAGGPAARSAPDGSFVLAPLTPGREVRIRASHPDLATAVVAATPAAGGRQATVRLRLGAVRRAFGRVTDEAGEPLAGAEVALRPSAGRTATVAEPVRGVTDESGRFELVDVSSGRFDLAVRASGFAPATVPAIEIAAAAPDAATPAGPGPPPPIDVGTVSLRRGAVVEGRVTDPRGRPLAGAAIRLRATGERAAGAPPRPPGDRPAAALSDGDGRFRLEDLAPEQTLDLEVGLTGFAAAAVRGVRPGSELLQVVLEPAGAVTGVVVDADEGPVGEARLRLVARGGEDDGPADAAGRRRYATSGPDGHFTVRGLAAGSWDLTVAAAGYRDAVREGVEVVPGAEPAELRLELERGAEVAGRVTGPDGEPVVGAEIAAGTSATVAPARRTVSDGEGRYRLAGLDPGPTRFTVEHPEYRRLVREREVERGRTRLDLGLERGAEITGRVIDGEGLPVAGARVTARAPSEGYATRVGSGPGAVTSAADGGFRIAGLSRGSYTVSADKPGYAAARTRRPVAVGDGPVPGVELRLTRGVDVAGRVLGVDFDELAGVRVVALEPGSPTPPATTEADFAGRYRLTNLRPGDWLVIARLDGSGKTAQKSVHLVPGAGEVRLDLELGGGLTLAGRVVRGSAPVAGAQVQATAEATLSGSWTDTDQSGRFRLEGLDPGRYALELLPPSGGPAHRRSVELAGDRDLLVELEEAAVRGVVLAAADDRPIAGAVVALTVAGGHAAGTRPTARSDSAGAFALTGLAPDRYRLQARSPGYGVATADVEARAGGGEPVEIRLRRTEGLDLRLLHATGAPAAEARVVALDAGGRPVLAGTYPAEAGGWVRLDELPAGSWSMLAATAGSATGGRRVTAPGEPVTLVLPEAGALAVRVPALAGSGRRAALRLFGPAGGSAGRPYRAVRFRGVQESWELIDGRGLVPLLPAGDWLLEVRSADGADAWSATARVPPGGMTEVVVE